MNDHEPGDRRAWRTENEWNRLRARIDSVEAEPRPRVTWRGWGLAAAATVAAVAVSLLVARSNRSAPSATTRLAQTKAGERLVVRLSDSSVMTLGPATTARITLSRTERRVELDGLAEFVVVHDSSRPFVVRAGNAVATDIGTSFVVRAYAPDSVVRVSVNEGEVSLARHGANSAAISLHPGEVGVVADSAPVLERGLSAMVLSRWVDGGLSFENETLASVSAELGRWFDADVRIADAALADRRISAVYSDPTLAGVLDALGATMGFTYQRSGRVVTILPRAR